MTRLEFISYINNRLTKRCSLPFKLPTQALEDVIEDALDWFYKNYEDALEESYLGLELSLFQTEEFKRNRIIKLYKNVMHVGQVFESRGYGDVFGAVRDVAHVLNPEDLQQVVAYELFRSLSNKFTTNTITCKFNENSKNLRVMGRTPCYNVVAQVFLKVQEQHLNEDKLFKDYVLAMSMIELGFILGTYEYELPGGVNINADQFKDRGETMLEEIKERVSEDAQPYWMITDDGTL